MPHSTDLNLVRKVFLIHLLHILHYSSLACKDLHHHAQKTPFRREGWNPCGQCLVCTVFFPHPNFEVGLSLLPASSISVVFLHTEVCLLHLSSSFKPGPENHPKANLTSPTYAQKHFIMPCADTMHGKVFMWFFKALHDLNPTHTSGPPS